MRVECINPLNDCNKGVDTKHWYKSTIGNGRNVVKEAKGKKMHRYNVIGKLIIISKQANIFEQPCRNNL